MLRAASGQVVQERLARASNAQKRGVPAWVASDQGGGGNGWAELGQMIRDALHALNASTIVPGQARRMRGTLRHVAGLTSIDTFEGTASPVDSILRAIRRTKHD